MGKGPDWRKTGTIVAYADWLRKRSGALAVVVVRRDDAALAADPDLAPADAQSLVAERVADLARDLPAARAEKRPGARVVLDPLHE
ncbi:hypothetical protein ACOBR2_06545 [Telmatobacter bradus]|uniref:hypothetical protein n=1 Tax=Telmatobacter bradus TaxID=474953 RepID=UPI003B4345BC